jgi:hypothetical protein
MADELKRQAYEKQLLYEHHEKKQAKLTDRLLKQSTYIVAIVLYIVAWVLLYVYSGHSVIKQYIGIWFFLLLGIGFMVMLGKSIANVYYQKIYILFVGLVIVAGTLFVVIETFAYGKDNPFTEWTHWSAMGQLAFWMGLMLSLGGVFYFVKLLSGTMAPHRESYETTAAERTQAAIRRWATWMNFGPNTSTYVKRLGMGIVGVMALRWLYHQFMGVLTGYDTMTEGDLLLTGPTSLQTVTVAGSYEQLNHTTKPIYSYGISGWIWINAFPNSSRKAIPIIQYGNMVLLQYSPEHNTMSVWTRHTAEDSFKAVCHIPKWALQTWVYVVINHTGSTMDVFIDGTLRKTIPHMLSYVSQDDMIVGTEHGGIDGDIRDLRYSTHPIKLSTIQWENNVGRWFTP